MWPYLDGILNHIRMFLSIIILILLSALRDGHIALTGFIKPLKRVRYCFNSYNLKLIQSTFKFNHKGTYTILRKFSSLFTCQVSHEVPCKVVS